MLSIDGSPNFDPRMGPYRKVNEESKYTKLIKYFHDNIKAKNNESSNCESPHIKHTMKIIRCIEKLSEEKFNRVAWYYYNTNEIKSKYDLFPHLDTAFGQSLVLKSIQVVDQGVVGVRKSPFNRYLVVKETVEYKEKNVRTMLEPYGVYMYPETMDFDTYEFHMFEQPDTLSSRIEHTLYQAGTIEEKCKYNHSKILERKTVIAYLMRHIWYLVSNAKFFGCENINHIIKNYILVPWDIEIFDAIHRLGVIDANSFVSKMASVTRLQAVRYCKIEKYMNEDYKTPMPANVAIDRYIEEDEDKSYPVIRNHYDLVYERVTWQIKQMLPEPYRYFGSMIAKTFLEYIFYYEKERGFPWFE